MKAQTVILKATQAAWSVVAVTSVLSLAFYLLLQVLHEDWPSQIGLVSLYMALLFNLFLLEGLQVAGLKIRARTENYHPSALSRKEQEIIGYFQQKFDDFVAGRQILTIATVVTMAAVLGHFDVPLTHQLVVSASELPWVRMYFGFLDSAYAGFLFAVFIPAWVSQLLPQYIADANASSFIKLPFSLTAIRLTSYISALQAGFPAQIMAKYLTKSEQ